MWFSIVIVFGRMKKRATFLFSNEAEKTFSDYLHKRIFSFTRQLFFLFGLLF